MFIYLDNSIENLKELYYILGVQALFQFLYIEWMNEAYENYAFILYKTLIIRIAMLVAIFTFVKTADDIVPYAIIMSATTILNYLLSFLWIKRELSFVKIGLVKLIKASKPLLTMLLLANANMLYTLLDRMFITKGPDENYISYYTIALNIVILIANVLSGAINVSIPRLGYYLGKKDYKSYKNLKNPLLIDYSTSRGFFHYSFSFLSELLDSIIESSFCFFCLSSLFIFSDLSVKVDVSCLFVE